MIKILIVFLLFTTSLWARVNLELKLEQNSVKQGQIAEGKLFVRESDGASSLSGLKGKNIGKTLYVLSVAPFMGKQGQLESDVKVIFVAVPQVETLTEVVDGEETVISWSGIEVVPTEPAKSFIFGDFEIPARLNLLPWILGLVGLGFALIIGLWLKKKFATKASLQLRRRTLKNELIGAISYDDVVMIWRQKLKYLEAFPEIEGNFKSFETVLFKYQFKQQRTEREITEVLNAYQHFKSEVSGVLNGI